MSALYNSTDLYDTDVMYDHRVEYNFVRKDIFISRGSDFFLDLIARGVDRNPVDLSGWDLVGKIYEYWNTESSADITCTILAATEGLYQISIDDLTVLNRPRYVYEVHMVSGLQKLLLLQGQLLVE